MKREWYVGVKTSVFVGQVRRALDSMGCFRDIGVFIDVSAGPGATPDGLEVSFALYHPGQGSFFLIPII
jgi:hypothetical protein